MDMSHITGCHEKLFILKPKIKNMSETALSDLYDCISKTPCHCSCWKFMQLKNIYAMNDLCLNRLAFCTCMCDLLLRINASLLVYNYDVLIHIYLKVLRVGVKLTKVRQKQFFDILGAVLGEHIICLMYQKEAEIYVFPSKLWSNIHRLILEEKTAFS